jgi:hypothetical protein
MRTFLEYSYNLQQVSDIFNKMVGDKSDSVDRELSFVTGMVPAQYMDKLPDAARGNAALVLRRILLHKVDAWDEVGKFVEPLWDQPIGGPGKTLGRDLLNWVSAKVMEDTGSDFFLSYSGDLSKSAAHHYTKKHPRVFVTKNNYRWGTLNRVMSTIRGDYAEHFNNYRQKQLPK